MGRGWLVLFFEVKNNVTDVFNFEEFMLSEKY